MTKSHFFLHPEFECPGYYIQTRYYRSPEVILGMPFDTQTDMWSVGIILAEFYLGVPPFFGETETDQLAAMMEVLGLVPAYMVARSPRKKVYFSEYLSFKHKTNENLSVMST